MAEETASLAEFARRIGCKRSYVTDLRKTDRLVLTDDGRRVYVAASLERINVTRDPSRAAVAARHAAARDTPEHTPPAAAEADTALQDALGAGLEAPSAPESLGYQHWRERNERAKALAGERDNAVAEGRLLVAVDVERALADAVTALRSRFESLPDTLGPQLAAITDEDRLRALLAGEIEHALDECARQFAAAARRAESNRQGEHA